MEGGTRQGVRIGEHEDGEEENEGAHRSADEIFAVKTAKRSVL